MQRNRYQQSEWHFFFCLDFFNVSPCGKISAVKNFILIIPVNLKNKIIRFCLKIKRKIFKFRLPSKKTDEVFKSIDNFDPTTFASKEKSFKTLFLNDMILRYRYTYYAVGKNRSIEQSFCQPINISVMKNLLILSVFLKLISKVKLFFFRSLRLARNWKL